MSLLDLPKVPAPTNARRVFGYASIGPAIGKANKSASNRRYYQRNRARLNAERRGAYLCLKS